MLITTAYEVAWMDVGGANLNDSEVSVSISNWLWDNTRELTVNELEREVGDTEQIALMCFGEVPAGLSDKLLKNVRWLILRSIHKLDFTE